MKRHGLDRVSLAVRLDSEIFPYDSRFLLGIQPFDKPVLRRYVHECVHLWQLLGSGYLTNMARTDWIALRRWEETGELTHRSNAFTRVDEVAKFSAWQLSEGLCRYWDVHISGPPELLEEPYAGSPIHSTELPDWMIDGLSADVIERLKSQRSYSGEQFDSWMLQEDAYAEPYRQALGVLGSKRAASLFPIVGHFALQTPAPARVYSSALQVLQNYPLPADHHFIDDIWRAVFTDVANACGKASFQVTSSLLTPGATVLKTLAQEGQPIYAHYFELMKFAQRNYKSPLDVMLGLPGDPTIRQELSTLFIPPVVLFKDGRWAEDPVAVKVAGIMPHTTSLDYGGMPGLLRQPQLGDTSKDLLARADAMKLAALIEV